MIGNNSHTPPEVANPDPARATAGQRKKPQFASGPALTKRISSAFSNAGRSIANCATTCKRRFFKSTTTRAFGKIAACAFLIYFIIGIIGAFLGKQPFPGKLLNNIWTGISYTIISTAIFSVLALGIHYVYKGHAAFMADYQRADYQEDN